MLSISNLIGRWRNRKHRHNRSHARTSTTRLRFEPLESREMLSASGNVTTLHFNIPPETANLGVQAGLYSNTSKVYLDPTSQTFEALSAELSQLPLFSLAAPATEDHAHTEPVQYELAIPSGQDVKSGELFLFVGEIHAGLVVSADGTVAAPKAAASPAVADVPDNFAQFEFNYQTTGKGAGLDIDISAVDSTGFPFTLVYPESANLSFPLNPLGITLDQTDLNTGFREAFEDGGQYAAYPEFAQCATFAQQQDPESLQVVAPQDILSLESTAPILKSVTPTADTESQLAAGASYSYCITAFSDNLIANSDGVAGETLLSNSFTVSGQAEGTSNTLTWTQYYDPNTAGYNIYRYSTSDGTAPTDSTAYSFIATVYGATTTTYVDQGAIPQAKQISVDTHSCYGFNPLSEYYTQELLDFFSYYTAPNSFSIERNGALWVGNTVSYTPSASWNETGATYTVLQLTAQNDVGTKIKAGDVINIYQPIFSSNTRYVPGNAPPMPNWMVAAASAQETPAQMVFGCDAAFASDQHDPDVADNTDLATALAAIENSIVSAFNRGIATQHDIPPDNWASFPQVLDYPTVATNSQSQVTSTTTYYYAVTAVNVYGETTPSMSVAATLNAGEAATLNWANGTEAAPATGYKIYRGTSPYDLKLLDTISDGQQTSYTDLGGATVGSAPPNQYFALGTQSNWYAAVVQTNSLVDPENGVSINGLSYGFPYSDQGGTSTNILFPPGDIPETITVNLGSPTAPGFVTQSLPDALVNSPYSQTIVASGSGTDLKFAVIEGSLPSWLALDEDTGVLQGTAPSSATSSPYSFVIQITDSTGSTSSMPFEFDVIDAEPVAPVTVAGLSGTTLTLTAADVNLAYTTQIQATGGVGPYTLALACPQVSLPTGIELGTLGTSDMTSSTGVFTLSGTQTSVSSAVGFDVIVSDSTVAKATAVIGISVKTVEINAAGTGYAVGDRFSVTGGGGSGAVVEVATVGTSGEILTLSVVDAGSGFTGAPTAVTPSSVSGTGAVLGARGDRFVITGYSITNSGSGYAEAPSVKIWGGGVAKSKTVTASLGTGTQSGQVAAIDLPAAGVYFTPAAGLPQVQVDPPSADAQCSFTMNITVNPTLAIGTATLPDAVKGQAYCQTITTNQVTNGVQYAVTSGSLPAGLTLEPWGMLCGTPTAAGSFSFTVTATDVAGATASKTYNSFEVATTSPAALTITTTALPSAVSGTAYSQTISTTGGSSGGITFRLVNGVLLDGLSLSSSGQITGTPTSAEGNVALFTVRATDSAGNAAFQGYELSILSVTPATTNLAANATTLVIEGAGFDTTPGNNTVALPGSGATNITVTSATSTRLEVSFDGPLATGALQATVTVNGVTSQAQQVATVTASSTPTITASTNRVAANATELMINGTGFDTSSQGTNTVSLSSGTVKSVTVNSATQLTLAVEGPLTVGTLTATVTTNGVSSASQQVANVVAANVPAIDANSRNLFENADTVVIYGIGFDTSAEATTQVELKLPSQSVTFSSITVNSATMMTVNGVSLPQPGVLTAKVTVNGIESEETTVANVLPDAVPVLVVPSTLPNVAPNATSLTLYGWGFTSGSSVVLQYNDGAGWVAISGFTTTVDSPNQITITDLSIPTPTSGTGTLSAIVNDPTNSTSGGIQAVGTILTTASSAPTIVSNSSVISSETATLTIQGTGFDPNGMNVVSLFVDGVALPAAAIKATAAGAGQEVTASSDGTSLTVTLAGPLPLGDLTASVVTDGVAMAGNPVQVATVAGLSITEATNKISDSPTLLTIEGNGFDPNGVNLVTLYTGTGTTELPASTIESVVADSATQLTVILNTSSPLPVGELFTTVSVNGISSGTPVQIAEVVAQGPQIEMSANQLSDDGTTLVINGLHFGTAAGSNQLVLSTVDGPVGGAVKEVTVNSDSRITVTLVPGELKAGELYASIETTSATSATVLVADVVPATASTETSVISVASRFLPCGETTRVTLQANDSLGRSVTAYKLEVTFALAPGSAGGVIGPVTDNGDGTYTTTFTSSVDDNNILIASINGHEVASTGTVTFYGNLPWHHPVTRTTSQSIILPVTQPSPRFSIQSSIFRPTRTTSNYHPWQTIGTSIPVLNVFGLSFRSGGGGLPQNGEDNGLDIAPEDARINVHGDESVEPEATASPLNEEESTEEPQGPGSNSTSQETAEQDQSHG